MELPDNQNFIKNNCCQILEATAFWQRMPLAAQRKVAYYSGCGGKSAISKIK
jgi:hypothetical protein